MRTRFIVVVISPIHNLIKTVLTNLQIFQNIQSKLRKSFQTFLNSSGKILMFLVFFSFFSFKINSYFSTKYKKLYFLKFLQLINLIDRQIDRQIDKQINHLYNNENCFASVNPSCVSILVYAARPLQIKIEEGMYIGLEKPNISKQLNHLTTTLSLSSDSSTPILFAFSTNKIRFQTFKCFFVLCCHY